MKVICIDSSKKPKIIPNNEWVEEGKIYTVKSIINLPLQPTIKGFLLNEISLSPKCFPYEFYNSNRFEIIFNNSENIKESITKYSEEELTI